MPRRIVWVRSLIALFQLALWTAAALVAAPGSATTAILLVVQAFPVSIGSSLYLQTDTTLGVLLAGLIAAVMAKGGRWGIWAAVFLLGTTGKQEWLVCLVGAVACAAGWEWKSPSEIKRWLPGILLSLIVGAFLGRSYHVLNWDGEVRRALMVVHSHNVISARELHFQTRRTVTAHRSGLERVQGEEGLEKPHFAKTDRKFSLPSSIRRVLPRIGGGSAHDSAKREHTATAPAPQAVKEQEELDLVSSDHGSGRLHWSIKFFLSPYL